MTTHGGSFLRKRISLLSRIRPRQLLRFPAVLVAACTLAIALPPQNSQAIFTRMQTQRQQEAALIRAEGEREKLTKQAEAEKQKVVIIANAQKQGQILRGEGDGKATTIYNDAYGQDPKFFDFYRSMQALANSLGGDSTTYVGPASGDFFRYFGAGNQIPPAGGASAGPSP